MSPYRSDDDVPVRGQCTGFRLLGKGILHVDEAQTSP